MNNNLKDDRLREECGVFGVLGHPDAAQLTVLGLHALQHRGQEAVGIVTFDGTKFQSEKRLGLVGDNFTKQPIIERLSGISAIGHVRYSTRGETILRNVQPLYADLDTGGFSVGHNGNLTNTLLLREKLVSNGAIFQSTSDTEVILHLVAKSIKNKFIDKFIDALGYLEGAYSLVALTNKKLIDSFWDQPGVEEKMDKYEEIYAKDVKHCLLLLQTLNYDWIAPNKVTEVEGKKQHFIHPSRGDTFEAVSYTHLTLPTSDLV